jgi:sensor histidine kinase YesM
LSARVPNLILQPLVENAVRHGLVDRPSAGRIVLRARRYDSTLELSVSDNGVGLPEGWKMNGRGVGLRNTVERMDKLYGDQARLAIENGDGGGVTVRLTLPWQVHAAAD